MKIFKLYPLVDFDSLGWCNSKYQGDVIVRAEDENKAADLASEAFSSDIVTKNGPCQETPRSPWNDSSAVKCIELYDSEYTTDGLAKVLKPNPEEF